jgi:hypothetical protein
VQDEEQRRCRVRPSRYTAPIGVAEWQTAITERLPAELESSLPTVEELEAELAGESGSLADDGEDQ